jgi:L-lactate dehydrogenase complex protein LldG
MIDTSPARAAILSSIRSAYVADSPASDSYAAVPRDYARTGALDADARLALFADRLREYDAGVHLAAATSIASTIGAILASRNRRRILISDDCPLSWLPAQVEFIKGNALSPRELDSFDGVLTGCTIAIALTGSLVLQNSPAQGPRSLSLVPDYHLCVVFAGQIVETVPEAFDRLKPTATLPTTFISGPSATADIEMTRIKGVHGPRFLDVIVVK